MQRLACLIQRLPRRLAAVLLLAATPLPVCAGVTPAATAVFNAYAQTVERRLAQQHATTFLTPFTAAEETRLRRGDLLLDHVTEANTATETETPAGVMVHHWRGTAFVPNATGPAFEHLLRDVSAYPQHFAPQVLGARLLSSSGDHLQAVMRVRQQYVLTVTLDTAYDIAFSHPDPHRGFSISRSTRISEIADAGTPAEHPLGPADEHGFLLRLNTFWTWEERDGGLYLQIESISLSRAIPQGLGWALRPYVESVPRDSLAFTLRSARNALAVSPAAASKAP